MTETEIRGNLTPDEFLKLKNFLETNDKLLDTYKRLTVDLSPGFDPNLRTWTTGSGTDLRIKKSNSKEKISLKLGDYHAKTRREFDITLKPGQFLETVEMFIALGFDSGMVYFWESWEYEFEGFEVKVSEFNADYHQWEIESKGGGDPDLLAKKLNLTPFSPESFKVAIDWQNQNVHELFSLDKVNTYLSKF